MVFDLLSGMQFPPIIPPGRALPQISRVDPRLSWVPNFSNCMGVQNPPMEAHCPRESASKRGYVHPGLAREI